MKLVGLEQLLATSFSSGKPTYEAAGNANELDYFIARSDIMQAFEKPEPQANEYIAKHRVVHAKVLEDQRGCLTPW